jgi:hypothetical protein
VSGVNFLKYRPGLWRLFCQNKIMFHNRLRERQFLEVFRSHGASARVLRHTIRPEDLEALKTLKVHESFAGMTSEELAVFRTTIVFSFPAGGEEG